MSGGLAGDGWDHLNTMPTCHNNSNTPLVGGMVSTWDTQNICMMEYEATVTHS